MARDAKKDAKSLAFGIADFLARSGAGPTTLKNYEYQLRRIETWLGKPLAQAGERDITDLKVRLRKMAASSALQYAAILRMFYKAAKREDLREILVLKQRLVKLAPTDILTVGEVQRMIESANSIRDRAVLACLWETGVRIHELLALDLKDVRMTDSPENAGRKLFVLWFRKTKSDISHEGYVIEAAPALEAWVKAHPNPRPEAPLFPSWHGNRLGPTDGWRIVKTAAKAARLEKRVYPHLFRHSRATHLLRLGMKEIDVKRLLGWSPASRMLEQKYAHLADRDTRRSYFAALGMQAEDRIDLGKLDLSEDRLKPVLAMHPPVGSSAPRTPKGLDEAEAREKELEELVSDPKVLRFLDLARSIRAKGA